MSTCHHPFDGRLCDFESCVLADVDVLGVLGVKQGKKLNDDK
jgi:hypothetical protein